MNTNNQVSTTQQTVETFASNSTFPQRKITSFDEFPGGMEFIKRITDPELVKLAEIKESFHVHKDSNLNILEKVSNPEFVKMSGLRAAFRLL